MNSTVEVKELTWQVGYEHGKATHFVDTILGRYAAWVDKDVAYVLIPDAKTNLLSLRQPVGERIEEAKQAAQADFDFKIRSALV